MGQTERGALWLMAVTVVLWAFSWVAMKSMVTLIGPFDLVMVRYIIAFLVLLGFALLRGHRLSRPPFWLTLGVGVFPTAAFQCLCQLALITGGAGHVVMLAYTMPFWVVLFAWWLLQEQPTRRHMIGFASAAAGLFAIIAPWQGLGSITGSLIALAGGACWGLGAVLSKKLFKRHGDVMNVAVWQMLLGAIFTWPLTQVFPQQAIVFNADLVIGLVYLSVFASALGWWLWLSVVRRVSATVAGMSSLGVPVLTVIFAWIFLGERASAAELIGIAFIMAGLVVVTTAKAAPARAAAASR